MSTALFGNEAVPMFRLTGSPDNGSTPKNSYCMFRSVVPRAGELDIFCRNFHELFVDGMRIARGPVTSADPLLYFDRFRLAGENSFVAIRIHRRTGVPELCFRMRDTEGRQIELEWECRSCRAYRPAPPLNVGNVGYSEFYDFSAGGESWFSRIWTDGGFAAPVPVGTIGPETFMPDYALILVLFIRWYYEVTGDRELLTEISGNLKAALNLFDRLRENNELIGEISILRFLYLDNTSDLRRTGKSAALNAAAEIFDALGEDGKPYRDKAARILPVYRRMFEKDGGLRRDSSESRDFELRSINFFCEFNSYHGRQVHEDLRQPSWSRPAPCYELDSMELPLCRGRNTIRFEVRHNLLKWDLFLYSPHHDFTSGRVFRGTWGESSASGEKAPFSTRPWYPPAIRPVYSRSA